MADTPSSVASDASDHPDPHSRYRLRVTAGPAYDSSTHHIVPVNQSAGAIENEHIILSYAVRIPDFTGLPSSSPESDVYFQHPLHRSDQYSIAFSFIPKVDIPGNDLVFGNDFDRPIRDRLPPGFGQALKFVKYWIDPGLDGDVYGDKPYLYGPALSSWNMLRIGDKIVDPERHNTEEWKIPSAEKFHELVVEEGADGSGEEVRSERSIPADAAARKKHFLTEANREDFVFERGRQYMSDFANPYLCFNDFSLKLPGFSLNIIKYVDYKTHQLRYTLKNRKTDEVYAVIMFELLWGPELEEAERKDEAEKKPVDTTTDKKEETNQDIPDDDDDVD